MVSAWAGWELWFTYGFFHSGALHFSLSNCLTIIHDAGMSPMDQQDWSGRTRRVQRLVNAVMVAESLCIPCFATGALLGLVWYGGRRADVDLRWLAGVTLLFSALFLAAWGWRSLRGRMFTRADAAALMDEQLGLHAALSAGAQWGTPGGNAAAAQRADASVVRVRSWSPLAWMAGGLALALCGALLPLPQLAGSVVFPDVPPALAQVEAALDAVEKMEEVDDASVEPFREQLENLKRMPREEMYSHAGLEALDALKNKTGTAMAELANRLQQANAALAQSAPGDGKGREDVQSAMQALREAMQGLEGSGLNLDGAMAEQLNGWASASRQLDPETLRRLQERLRHASTQLQEMCETCGMASVASPGDGDLACQGGEEGTVPSDGGVSRGRGDAPLAFHPEGRERLDTVKQQVNHEDLEHAALGAVAGVEVAAPSPEEDGHRLEQGGRAAQPARGGDAVWSENLTPQEQSALKGIFK